eukprot:6187116-Pleurochrysis_carterae.AAC.1
MPRTGAATSALYPVARDTYTAHRARANRGSCACIAQAFGTRRTRGEDTAGVWEQRREAADLG